MIHVNHVVHVIDSRDLRDGAVVNPSRFHKQSMHVSWRRSSLRDNVWNHLCRKMIVVKGFTTAPFRFLRRALCLCPFLARHGRVHWNIQLSPCVFDGFFTIFRIDEINASQPSSIVESWLVVCPFLLFFLLSILDQTSGQKFSGLVSA